jgi:uncharacterized protein (TIGR02588 family)
MADTKSRSGAPALEWIAAGIGLMLILGVFAILAREALGGEADQLPAIEVTAGRMTSSGAGFVVEFRAVNRSGGTAAAVEIEGQLESEGAVVETSTAVVDYVAGHGTVEGGLYFSRDPRKYPVKLRALGFQTP